MTNITAERQLLAQQGLDIEYRDDWGAVQDYTSDRRVDTPALGFFLHISVTIDHGDLTGDEHADMRTIERIGQQRFGDPYDQQLGFPYNGAAFDTGRLYEGQPLSRRGAHTVNDKGVEKYGPEGASLNYAYRALVLPQMVADDVTDAQVDAAARWAAAQIRAGLAIRGARWDLHRTVAWKDCPGDAGAARLDELNRLTAHYEANGLQEDDMPWTAPQLQTIVEEGIANQFAKIGSATRRNVDRLVDASVQQQLTEALPAIAKAVVDEMTFRSVERGSGLRRGIGTSATSQIALDLRDPESALAKALADLGYTPPAAEPAPSEVPAG